MRELAVPLMLVWLAGLVSAQEPASTNATAPTRPSFKTTDLFPDTVVAKGKGVEVKRSQMDEEVIRFKAQAAGRGQPIAPEATPRVEQYVLNQLIQIQLLNAKATPADKSAAATEAQKRLADAESKLGPEALNHELKLLGISREDLVAKWTEMGTADTVAKRELKVTVSDDEISSYFRTNQPKFEQPEMVLASHILLSTQDPTTHEELSPEKKDAKHKQMEELLKRARAGEDFAKLARDSSEDPGSKSRGGEYQFARGEMVKEFENAAFGLNTNQISDIVTTSYGYHIIKLAQKIPARKAALDDEVVITPKGYLVLKQYWHDLTPVAPAAKVSAVIRQTLETQQFQKQWPDYLEKLKKEAGIEIPDERFKAKPGAEPAAVPPSPATLQPTTK